MASSRALCVLGVVRLICSFHRIQFTSDLLPSDVVGISLYTQADGSFEFKQGPVFTNVLLADEINRTTPKTQSALLEAMNEEQVTVDNRTYMLPRPFVVIATQNPIEHHGTYPLPESQLDRFLLRIRVGYPGEESEKQIVRAFSTSKKIDAIEPVVTVAEVIALQDRVTEVRVDESLLSYMVAVAGKTRASEFLTLGVSPRGSMALFRAAQARAVLQERDYVTPDDVKALIVPVFSHRVMVNSRYASTLKKSHQADQILHDLIETVPVPL